MARYLERIGVEAPAELTAEALGPLQAAHLLAVPFENLSVHLGEPISLDEAALIDKVVDRRRGGFCYELNGAFAALLGALGFSVALMGARVFGGGQWGPPFDHLALRVEVPEPWLVDVGFGQFSRHPLRLDAVGEAQPDANGSFTVEAAPDGDLEVLMDGVPQYRLEVRPRALVDFEPTCWWQQTSPRSHFTQSLVCSLPTERGRATLSDRLLIETVDGVRTEQTLEADDDVLAAYRRHFGIELTEVPRPLRALSL